MNWRAALRRGESAPILIGTTIDLNMRLILVLVASIAATTACASPSPTMVFSTPTPPKSWHGDGSRSLNVDLGECKVLGYGTPGLDATQQMMTFMGCMQARGWGFY